MAASGSLSAFSVVPSSTSRQDSKNPTAYSRAAEAEVLSICVRARVCCIGIAGDLVLFQPVVTSLSIPIGEFADAERAIALIRAKLAEVQR